MQLLKKVLLEVNRSCAMTAIMDAELEEEGLMMILLPHCSHSSDSSWEKLMTRSARHELAPFHA